MFPEDVHVLLRLAAQRHHLPARRLIEAAVKEFLSLAHSEQHRLIGLHVAPEEEAIDAS